MSVVADASDGATVISVSIVNNATIVVDAPAYNSDATIGFDDISG